MVKMTPDAETGAAPAPAPGSTAESTGGACFVGCGDYPLLVV